MAKLSFPFTLGVASGEPTADGVMLWTRLAPDPLHPTRPGGMPNQGMSVNWRLAEDEGLTRVVRSGTAAAQPDWAHSVHVRVSGLRPATEYFYRFSIDGHVSTVGRTKTAPAPDSTAPVRFGVASCQRYEHGYFTALRHLADERPDLILHLGDYIYEYGKRAGTLPARPVDSVADATTIGGYRNRYALYRKDPDLQAAHAAAPWVPVPDDHEVRDNYAGALPGDGSSPAAFLKRRTAAYKAYYEHMPLRVRPVGNTIQLFRWRPYGKVLDFLMADVRQYREGRDMLGAAQEKWLTERLTASTARWKVLAQSVFFAPRKFPLEPVSSDAWDGFPQARERVLAAAPPGFVVLSGDVHNSWAAELGKGVEFTVTAVSSRATTADGGAILDLNPHIKYFDANRGYLTGEVSMEEFRVAYRAVEFVDRKGAGVSTVAEFRVVDGALQRSDL